MSETYIVVHDHIPQNALFEKYVRVHVENMRASVCTYDACVRCTLSDFR